METVFSGNGLIVFISKNVLLVTTESYINCTIYMKNLCVTIQLKGISFGVFN